MILCHRCVFDVRKTMSGRQTCGQAPFIKGDLPMKKLIIILICAAAILLSGCAFTSPEQTHGYATQGIDAIDRNTEANLNIARANPTLDPVKVAEAGKTFEDQRESYREAFEQIRKQIEEEKQQREAIVTALGSIAIEALPAGSSALQVAKAIGLKIDTAADKKIEAANEKTKEVETTANDNKKVIAALSVTTDGIVKDTKILESRMASIETSTEELLEEKSAVRTDFAVAKEKFNSLSTSMQEKLSQVPESVIQDLTKLKADDEAFRDKLQRELQITDAQMESLKGLSTEEILGLLAAAGAATGAGGALAKTGKSRGAGEIDALRRELAKVEGRLDNRTYSRTTRKTSASE